MSQTTDTGDNSDSKYGANGFPKKRAKATYGDANAEKDPKKAALVAQIKEIVGDRDADELSEEEMAKVRELIDILSRPDLENAFTDLDEANYRIFQLEAKMDDLIRAVEIAVVSRQFNLIDAFSEAATEALKTRLVVKDDGPTKVNLTVYENFDKAVDVLKDKTAAAKSEV
jgi:hypothetical protein